MVGMEKYDDLGKKYVDFFIFHYYFGFFYFQKEKFQIWFTEDVKICPFTKFELSLYSGSHYFSDRSNQRLMISELQKYVIEEAKNLPLCWIWSSY